MSLMILITSLSRRGSRESSVRGIADIGAIIISAFIVKLNVVYNIVIIGASVIVILIFCIRVYGSARCN